MTPKALPGAIADLERGREFYDLQESGVGDYFVQRAFADIESLRLYGGIHRIKFGFHFVLVHRFPWRSTTRWKLDCPLFFAYSIAVPTQILTAEHSQKSEIQSLVVNSIRSFLAHSVPQLHVMQEMTQIPEFNPSTWFAQFTTDGNPIPQDELKPDLEFTLIWNLFEREVCAKFANSGHI
ncbi:MAG: hypothetical protein ABF325_08050 [Lentimonas sp.]